jgi:hypothetical protein
VDENACNFYSCLTRSAGLSSEFSASTLSLVLRAHAFQFVVLVVLVKRNKKYLLLVLVALFFVSVT